MDATECPLNTKVVVSLELLWLALEFVHSEYLIEYFIRLEKCGEEKTCPLVFSRRDIAMINFARVG